MTNTVELHVTHGNRKTLMYSVSLNNPHKPEVDFIIPPVYTVRKATWKNKEVCSGTQLELGRSRPTESRSSRVWL